MVRPDNPRSVYLDSNCLIYAVTDRPGSEPIKEILHRAQANKLSVVISPISYVEVRGWGRSDPYPKELDEQVIAILDHPALTRVEFNRRVALAARRVAHAYPLKNWDAMHLASAIEGGVDVFMTADSDFRRGEFFDGVWVDEPYIPGDQPLTGL